MQYKDGICNVINGDATVTGIGTEWLANVSTGDEFILEDGQVAYQVASVTNDTSLELNTTYAGATANNQNYVIARDFSANFNWALMQKGDLETAALQNRNWLTLDAQGGSPLGSLIQLNQYITVSDSNYLKKTTVARLNTSQSLSTDSPQNNIIDWTGADYIDTGDTHNPASNASRITVPTDVDYAKFTVRLVLDASEAASGSPHPVFSGAGDIDAYAVDIPLTVNLLKNGSVERSYSDSSYTLTKWFLNPTATDSPEPTLTDPFDRLTFDWGIENFNDLYYFKHKTLIEEGTVTENDYYEIQVIPAQPTSYRTYTWNGSGFDLIGTVSFGSPYTMDYDVSLQVADSGSPEEYYSEFVAIFWSEENVLGTTIPTELNDLDDVDLVSSPSGLVTGNVLTYNGSEWVPQLPAGLGSPISTNVAWGNIIGTLSNQADLQSELDGKSDTGHTHSQSDITDLVSDLANKLEDITTESIGDLNDVTLTLGSPQVDKILKYNGSVWIDSDTSFISITESQISDLQSYLLNINSEDLGDLNDVSITNTKGDILVVNNSSIWVDLSVGSDGQYLIADSAQSTGIKWGDIPQADLVVDLGEFTIGTIPAASGYPNGWAVVTDYVVGSPQGSPFPYTVVRSDGTNWIKVVSYDPTEIVA